MLLYYVFSVRIFDFFFLYGVKSSKILNFQEYKNESQ